MEWFRALKPFERRAFWACFGGWALDAMDVQLYAVALPTIMGLWHLSRTEAGSLGTVALIVSSIGGWVAGILADRFGRVRVLQLTILWFSVFTFVSGLANSYNQLLVARSLQGLGFGGEWAAGAVLMAETVDARYRGKAVAAVQSGWSIGYGVAAIMFAIMFNLFPPDYAWRALFFVGIIPALLVLFIRRLVEEPKVFREARVFAVQEGTKTSLLAIFDKTHRGMTGFAMLLCMGVLGGNYTVLTWLPTFLQTVHHLSYTNTGLFLAVNIIGSFVGYILGGYCSDGLGRRGALTLFAILGTATVVGYVYYGTSAQAVLVLGFPLGFCQSGMNAGIGSYLSELFPTRLRANAQGFCYNAGRGVGALFPTLVGVAGDRYGLTAAIAAAAATAYALVLLAVLMLPETRGKVLTATA